MKRTSLQFIWCCFLLSLILSACGEINERNLESSTTDETVVNEEPAGGEEGELTYRYDNLPTPDEASVALAEFSAISKWPKLDINYFFVNGTERLPDNQEHVLVRQAFDIWAEQTPLTFTEVTDRGDADILHNPNRGIGSQIIDIHQRVADFVDAIADRL